MEHKHHGDTEHHHGEHNAEHRFRKRWHRFVTWLCDLKASDAMMVFLTFVIAGTGVVGIILVIQGGKDTQRLVEAAQKSANAAKSFADSATKINTGISDAVSKLELQATANQTLAQAANTANTNTVEADRPWIGAVFTVDGFAAGKTPTYTVTFMNTGKRPAKVTLSQTLATPNDFKDNPIYRPYDAIPSTTFLVPGQAMAAPWKDTGPISQELMKAFSSGLISLSNIRQG